MSLPTDPYPHEVGCHHCRDARPKLCHACGGKAGTLWDGRCTNGHCGVCHRTVCQIDSANHVHGYGSAERRQRAADRRRKEVTDAPAS